MLIFACGFVPTCNLGAMPHIRSFRTILDREVEVDDEPPMQIGGPKDVAELIHELTRDELVEVVFAVLLDVDKRLLPEGIRTVVRGLSDEAAMHQREVFSDAVRLRAHSIILAHNHPAGAIEPSPLDLEALRMMRAAGEVLGIPVLDQVIVGPRGDYCSCAALEASG